MAFRFKQFRVEDAHSTMKVGTDAVLLGAWAKPPVKGSILDIGTGCGVIALMMAQKSMASITAIDIDALSITQASSNFAASPWKNRLTALHLSLEEYAKLQAPPADFIVSNPPFFINCLRSEDKKRNLARHTDDQALDMFLQTMAALLNPTGSVAIIMPYSEKLSAQVRFEAVGLHVYRMAEVTPRESKPPTRLMMEAGWKKPEGLVLEHLVLRHADGLYTRQYKNLTGEYYLFLNE